MAHETPPVGTFPTHQLAEEAARELQEAGFQMSSFSIAETLQQANHYLLLLHGTAVEVEEAKTILRSNRPAEPNIHLDWPT